jgi:hypothetical protein
VNDVDGHPHHYEVRVAGHTLASIHDDEASARDAAAGWSLKLHRQVVVEAFDELAERMDGGQGALVLVAVYDDGVAV